MVLKGTEIHKYGNCGVFATHVQGIVAKPLVETLRLKKNRERKEVKMKELMAYLGRDSAEHIHQALYGATMGRASGDHGATIW